jgi:hypothetical protein
LAAAPLHNRPRVVIFSFFFYFLSDTARQNAPSKEILKTIENTTILRIYLDKLKRLTGTAGVHHPIVRLLIKTLSVALASMG